MTQVLWVEKERGYTEWSVVATSIHQNPPVQAGLQSAMVDGVWKGHRKAVMQRFDRFAPLPEDMVLAQPRGSSVKVCLWTQCRVYRMLGDCPGNPPGEKESEIDRLRSSIGEDGCFIEYPLFLQYEDA